MPKSKPKNWYERLDEDTQAIALGIGFIILRSPVGIRFVEPTLRRDCLCDLRIGDFHSLRQIQDISWSE